MLDGPSAGLYYRHSDHLGSTSVLSNANGHKVPGSEVVYAPFGEVRAGELSALTDFGYTGQRLDRSTGGLMYYGARYYLPGLRRFILADTIVPEAANPQAFNHYAYTLNNPVRYSDPSGHRPMSEAEHRRATNHHTSSRLGADRSRSQGVSGYFEGGLGTGTEYNYVETDWRVEDTRYEVSQEYYDRITNALITGHAMTESPIFPEGSYVVENEVMHDGYAIYDPADPLSRGPDYSFRQFSVSLAFSGLVAAEPISMNYSRMDHRYGNSYFSWGIGGGEGLLLLSGNISSGYLYTQGVPTERQMEEFMTGLSVNANAGFLLGGGFTFSDQ